MDVVSQVRQELQKSVDPDTMMYSRSFFKEEIKSLGIKIPVVNEISKKLFKQIEHLSKDIIFGYCEKLLKSGYVEEAFVAFRWSDYLKKRYEPEDFVVFERWLSMYVSNWAECDTLCNHTLGTFVEQFPEYVERLKEWTQSQNRWLRRGAAVTLVLPARKGLFFDDVLEIADKLLQDKDDLVQKGYGWMLKETSARKIQFFPLFCDLNKEESTEIYITIERSIFEPTNDDYTAKVTNDPEEIKNYLETGFEFVCNKDDLVFLRKRK